MDTLKKLIRRQRPLLLVMAFSIMLMACGGGGDDRSGSESDGPGTADSNQWDTMAWDQGQWG